MDRKRYLNIFNNQNDYDVQKEEMMGIPHVILLEETDEIIYVSTADDYSFDYFTLHTLSDGNITLYTPSSYEANSLAYSLNDSDWVNFDAETTLSLENDNKVRVKCVTTAYHRDSNQPMFSGSCVYEVYGNTMSLLCGDAFIYKTELNDKNSFKALFYNQSTLKHAQNLILPATTLADSCYSFMFFGCTGLTTIPELSATTLAYGCYSMMFRGCTSLTTAPELPATTLADSCYRNMFFDCTSLSTAPELLATTLADSCYYGMFVGCTSLTAAPALPATTLASNCYNSMFYGCTSLTAAPALPATTLADSCYMEMFSNCTSLTTALELPATTLAESCYRDMFFKCTSLTTAPQLLATTLASFCCFNMFWNCTSLTTAPELHATTLATSCYSNMFKDCSKLNKITMLATDISAGSCLYNWVEGVASSGTFVKNYQMTTLPNGINGIPNGWAVQDYNIDYSVKYFTIRALNDGEMVLYSPDSFSQGSFQYSLNNEIWIQFGANQNILSLNKNDELRVQCVTNAYSRGINNTMFSGSCEYEVYGNILSLLYGDMFEYNDTLKSNNSFKHMFNGQSTLKRANNLILLATTLASNCYDSMFQGCTSLTTAPELPATTLATSCYSYMFYGCTSLTTAPQLPATTLANYCYISMFRDCTSLTEAPELPATTLAESCYSFMFDGCSNLSYIKMLATDISASGCLNYWTDEVASSGTFVKHKDMTTLPNGHSGIPTGWTVENDNSNTMVEVDETSINFLSNVNVIEDSISINGENVTIENDKNNNYNIIID